MINVWLNSLMNFVNLSKILNSATNSQHLNSREIGKELCEERTFKFPFRFLGDITGDPTFIPDAANSQPQQTRVPGATDVALLLQSMGLAQIPSTQISSQFPQLNPSQISGASSTVGHPAQQVQQMQQLAASGIKVGSPVIS
ncbi:MAG: hypothetical protein EZS28_006052, partial [Streblomastix strix]